MTSKALKLRDGGYRCPECGFVWSGGNEWCPQCGHSKVCENEDVGEDVKIKTPKPDRNKYENELKLQTCPNCFCSGVFVDTEPRRWLDDNFELVDKRQQKFVGTCGLCKWTGDIPPSKSGQSKFEWKIFLRGVIQVGVSANGTRTPEFLEIMTRMEKSLADLEV